MENDLTGHDIAEHFGYAALANKHGCWKVQPGVFDRIRSLPEVLDPHKKIRVIFDYDPDFSRALIQIIED